ncbi:MAG: hypothetical protein LBU13_10330 [Synergistaceae bacterium]|jgi:hypothetical protein|nr:hypothetical protein [Synergistaceae bacterium]
MGDNKPLVLKLLGVIVDRAWTKKVEEILKEEQVRFHFIALGQGTAASDVMALLGLNSVDKSLFCCLVPNYESSALLRLIEEKVRLSKPGRGIGFTAPLSGVSGAALQLIAKDFESKGDDEKMDAENTEKITAKYDMVLSIINQGYTNTLMTAAKEAGARGGTVLHGRKCDVDGESKFFGIAPQLEKDIVVILTRHEMKTDIMRAISQACGMNTEAQGVVLSLPIDEIEGLKSVTSA